MGSSCYARGNGPLLDIIEEYVASRGLTGKIDIVGERCRDRCGSGPNVTIDGAVYNKVESGVLLDILEEHFGAGVASDE